MTERQKKTVDGKEHETSVVFNISIGLKAGDRKLVEWAADFLGTSKADFVRGAIRAHATQLQQIAKKIDG